MEASATPELVRIAESGLRAIFEATPGLIQDWFIEKTKQISPKLIIIDSFEDYTDFV